MSISIAALQNRVLIGTDIYFYSKDDMETVCKKITSIDPNPFKLNIITNRGVRVWPEGMKQTFCVDHWRARFVKQDNCRLQETIDLQSKLNSAGIDIIKTENLYTFDGKPAFSHSS